MDKILTNTLKIEAIIAIIMLIVTVGDFTKGNTYIQVDRTFSTYKITLESK